MSRFGPFIEKRRQGWGRPAAPYEVKSARYSDVGDTRSREACPADAFFREAGTGTMKRDGRRPCFGSPSSG